ncbi:MAG: DNA mismatch repair endonuclease MutL [Victivallales bacterium]|nr:DNA mismatch repair endonuclease MutL [Victivallales bacterium]
MSLIRILATEVANRIAAGEVIERPASVVKELVENAIDAGSGRILVQTEEGGKRLVQVDDDGCGMDRDDALLCLEAHATSKIRETADVGQIATLGFRGEALPSISSVSRFRLQTRRAEDQAGTEVLVENGSLRDVRECGCAPGTSIQVRHLFSSLPARRKFLRGAATEDGHIQETVLLQALAHPEIAFELRANGREVLHASRSSDPGDRIGMLMGRETLAQMLPVDYAEDGIRVHGFVAKPGFTRGSRREQRIFVNGRAAAAEVVYYGLREAYHTLVMKGRYPPVVLYLELDPVRVDVNVHPTKREVRFREARLVGQVVGAAVRRALRGLAVEAPSPSPPPLPRSPASPLHPASVAPAAVPFRLATVPSQPQLPLAALPPTPQPPPASPEPAAEALPLAVPPAAPVAPTAPAPAPALPGAREEIAGLRVMGTLQGTYLVAEGPRGLVLVDQRAAHKRILFERLLRNADGNQQPKQQLLLPATVELGPQDARLLQRQLDTFHALGFGVEPFGGSTFLVSAVPASLPDQDAGVLLREMLDDLREGSGKGDRPQQARVAQAACRHAIPERSELNREEIRQLLTDLAAAELPYTCPDGKPVVINLAYRDLEKRFGKRTGKEPEPES